MKQHRKHYDKIICKTNITVGKTHLSMQLGLKNVQNNNYTMKLKTIQRHS